MISRWMVVFSFGMAASALWGQDTDASKARRAKVGELRKQLDGSDEASKISALNELGGINDDEARSLLSHKMVSDSESVRMAAAKAIARQKRSSSAQALGRAVQSNIANDRLVKAFIDALAELDMCSGNNPLILALETKYSAGADALAALEKIGCPDAVPALINFLRRAEAEEKKPDSFEGANLGGGGGLPGAGGGGVGPEENRNKNKPLAALAGKARQTLSKLSGKSFPSYREWSAALASGQLTMKKTAVYLCEKTGQTYEVASGKSNKCANSDGKTYHDDTLLKHRRE